MESYLLNRQMRTKCKTDNGQTTKSEDYMVNYGTYQGLCLGPLLFLVFCNDLQLNLHHLKTVQFADNTTLYISHDNLNYLEFCINDDLTRIEDWFRANKLTLNSDKTVAIVFQHNTKRMNNTKSMNNLRIHIGNTEVPKLDSTKFLGIWIDSTLSWKTHISKLTSKLKTKKLKTFSPCMPRKSCTLPKYKVYLHTTS